MALLRVIASRHPENRRIEDTRKKESVRYSLDWNNEEDLSPTRSPIVEHRNDPRMASRATRQLFYQRRSLQINEKLKSLGKRGGVVFGNVL